MKTIAILIPVLIVLFLTLQSYLYMSTENVEKQPYRVIQNFGEIEIRFYPSATLATVKTGARNYRELSGSGFRRVAGYIFGGNEEGVKIAMTSPVHMDISPKGSSMSFVMPEGYNPSNLPKPNDEGIEISRSPDEYVAAIRFSGYASDNTIGENVEKLSAMLAARGISPIGNFRYLGYDPPYQIIGRRNEIIVSVDWKENGK
jgi:hypothetical protein